MTIPATKNSLFAFKYFLKLEMRESELPSYTSKYEIFVNNTRILEFN